MESTKVFESHKAYEGEAIESLFSEITKKDRQELSKTKKLSPCV